MPTITREKIDILKELKEKGFDKHERRHLMAKGNYIIVRKNDVIELDNHYFIRVHQ